MNNETITVIELLSFIFSIFALWRVLPLTHQERREYDY